MRIRFLAPALMELDEAIDYYDYQLPGLGLRFFREVDAALDKISRMPEAWTQVGENSRRCLLKGFPYALLYIAEPELIIITAVANLHRDPKLYNERTG